MVLNPDKVEMIKLGQLSINSTIFNTWIVMVVLIALSIIISKTITSKGNISKLQNLMETITEILSEQIFSVTGRRDRKLIVFLGTLFCFVLTANILELVPLYHPPTASISTTLALAFCVFVAVPFFGIKSQGLKKYLEEYLKPSFIMLPFNILSELSRTVALAIRLFGNIMGGGLVTAVFLSIVPFFVPIVLQLLGVVIGIIQAYIIFILSTVYIGAAMGNANENKKYEESVLNG